MSTVLTEADVAALGVAKVVDARGTGCPGPLLEAKKAMAGIAVGDVIELWSSDPQTKADVAAWAGKVGHGFLGAVAAQGYDRVLVRRAR
ncbi:MAG: sulfurtransferase TusA family protein [Candidatus Dormibacteria bacterium]|jgi:TusA-related sulfurtransferase